MNYWSGYMNWPIREDWKCEICDGYCGLTWGLVHAKCRCNNCHAVYYMRADDAERTVLDKPRLLVKPAFLQAAKDFHSQTGQPIDRATKDDWVKLGIPESKFFKAEEGEKP